MGDSTQGLTSCAACGIAFPLGARFCPNCGLPLEASLRKGTAPRAPLPGGDPLIGRVIAGRYRIVSPLGRGGMGVVYRVEHVHIGKLMAMKLLSGELASDPLTLKRFQREAQAVSQLSHPNTVQLFDFGESESLAYLVMEYLPGRDLATLIYEHGALPFERVAKIAMQIAGSVEEAHQRGIIHRDIKPENVMVLDTSEQQDFVKVLDFGIAKLRGLDDGAPATQKGHLIGTPYYMAPEQIRGDAIDGRVDVYALGALLYKAVTGEPPYVAELPMEVLTKHLNEPLVPPRVRAPQRDIPAAAEAIIVKALAKRADERHASMSELRAELERSVGAPSASPPRNQTLHVAQEVLVTRGDIDRYEGRLRRQHRMGWAAALLAVAAAGFGVYAWRERRPARIDDGSEREPNDTIADATTLSAGTPILGFLGKRISESESDADVYRIDLSGDARLADISLSALPNIDVLVDLVQQGTTQALLTVDSGAQGEAERIPNYLLTGDTYYVRVRGKVAPGALPVENVSDAYTLSLALTTPRADSEREPNDGFEVAEQVALDGEPRREGVIGWPDDRDVFCFRTRARRAVALSGVERLDLTLSVLDRRNDVVQRIDQGAVGEGEQAQIGASEQEREVCLTVAARERQAAGRANPGQPYVLTIR
jgi:eukaryotic-like serine/threonine-protein kinase